MKHEFVLLETNTIYKGKILSLYVDKIKSPYGQVLERDVVKRPDAVGLVALTKDKEVILVRQYRHPIKSNLLEVPAGLLEDYEDPATCAIRELKEETGYATKKVEKLGEFYTSAGFTDEKLHLYFTDEVEEGEPERELDEEDIRVELIPLKDAIDMALNGQLKDAKTIIGILMTAHKMG